MNNNKKHKTTFLDEAAVLIAADSGKVEVQIQREQDQSLPNGEILFSFTVSGAKTGEIRQKLVNGDPIPECLPTKLLNVRRALLQAVRDFRGRGGKGQRTLYFLGGNRVWQ